MKGDTSSTRVLRELFLAGFMAGLPSDEVAWAASRIARSMEDVRLRAGDVLYRSGEAANEQFLVLDGEMKLEAPGVPPWTLRELSIVGGLDVILERSRIRTATATRDTHLLRVSAVDWLDMLEDNFELTRRGVEGLARGVHELRLELRAFGLADDAPRSTRNVEVPARRLDLVERIFLLRSVPLFANGDFQSLVSLAELAHEVDFANGDALFSRRRSDDGMLVIVSGSATASREGTERRATFGPGMVVLGSAAVSRDDLGYAVRADSATRALRIAHEDYFDVMEEHFLLVRSAMKALMAEREQLANLREAKQAP